jgi:hypothetical protein
VTSDNPPKQPNKHGERREQANRIAAIGHRISEIGPQLSGPLRELVNQFIALVKEIQTNNKTTEAREEENQKRSFCWIKIGTISSIVLSFFSLVASIFALIVLYNQLYSMRIEQRAWIKIEYTSTFMEENKPLVVDLLIKNVGKTPAKRIEAIFKVKIVKKDESPDLDLNGMTFRAFSGILNQDGTIPGHIPMGEEKADLPNPPLLTKNEIAAFQAGEVYFVVFGYVKYFDVYNISHWIDFCNWKTGRPGDYSSMKCVKYNNVDNN